MLPGELILWLSITGIICILIGIIGTLISLAIIDRKVREETEQNRRK